MKLQFFGAARDVTGSCQILETGEHHIMIDCGCFQGGQDDIERNGLAFPFKPSEIDAVFLTHAHMDHIGRIPQLVKRGYRGPIYATAPTVELAPILWNDMISIMEEAEKHRRKSGATHGWPILYDEHDVKRAMERLQAVEYHQQIGVCEGAVKAKFHDAGHILGSSFIAFGLEGKTIVFSGDLGNDDVPLLRPTEKIPEADIIIVESTYGDRIHEDLKTRVDILRDAVKETVASKGVLIIPAFAIERTQEIILTLHHLAEAGEIPRVPMFLDSPLAIEATRVYEEFPQYYNSASRQEYLTGGQDLFSLPGLTATKSMSMSKEIDTMLPPKVIISGAGMMTGGRVVHHLMRELPNSNTTVLIVGYQAKATLGRQLYEGAKLVKIYGEEIKVNAKITSVGGWSAHADQKKLTEWVLSVPQPAKTVLVTHGEAPAAEALAAHLREAGLPDVQVPNPEQIFEL
jgi:metallo-beta-lactamase family protein